ncbi:MAG: DUF177 domain-containing protein [bacterium]|nr:DUF177 domain-containing protein [bacterium]
MQNTKLKISVRALKEGVSELFYLIPVSTLSIDELASDVAAQLVAIKKMKKVEIKGKIDFSMAMVCSRCLSDFTRQFSEELDSLFLPGMAPVVEELSPEDAKTIFYSGEEIDILPIIRDTILLSIPIKPLCSEACKGLCPICGKNLNEGACLCK